MYKTVFLFSFFFILTCVSAQDAKEYYTKGLEMAQQGKAEEAIALFDKSIALKDDEYVAWYNRGVTETMIHRYEDALRDFDRTIVLAPAYKKAYLNRGIAKKHLTDYDGAMADLDYALQLDSAYAEACFAKAQLNDLLGKRVLACLGFEKALRMGYKNAQREMDKCVRRPTADSSIHAILNLNKTAADAQYGYAPEHPVKTGMGPEGGPANERTYIELLRDAKGQTLQYERVGSCCAYKTTHALFGNEALLDKYQISYNAADGSKKTTIIYLSMYDYEQPLILAGLKTVR